MTPSFTLSSLLLVWLLPAQILAQTPNRWLLPHDSLSVIRPGHPGIYQAQPLDSLLRRFAWADAARAASAVDPGILILPDSSVQAAIRRLVPDEGVDQAMIFPLEGQELRNRRRLNR